MLIKKLTNKILNKILNEIKQPENMTKIEKIVLDPLIKYTYTRMYPYISMIIILLLLPLLLSLLILIILLKKII